MRLGELLGGIEIQAISIGGEGGGASVALGAVAELEIAEVRDDSREVGSGDLFVAVRGQTVDGHRFLGAAEARGAVATVVDREPGGESFSGVRVRVASGARALGVIAANRHGRPAEALTMIGVTGTNGKTTTTFLAEAAVRAVGGEPGVIGTVGYRWGGVARPADFTTPTPLALHRTLGEMRAAGCTHVAMECSSHALVLERLAGVRFGVAAFTNLTQDHLDLHGTMEAYREAKARLFTEHLEPGRGVAVVLVDHEPGQAMARVARGRVLSVSARDEGADVRVRRVEHGLDGIRAELLTPAGPFELRSPLVGAFNLENLVVGAGIAVALGAAPEAIGRALSGVQGVPGRVEAVANDRGLGVFVDYAHTPDALERVLGALRPLATGRLIVVFGCGGDRDRGKRAQMGQVAARDADLSLVTSDNPRSEDPLSIVEMILGGVRQERCPAIELVDLAEAPKGHLALVDRRQAIAAAIEGARPGDLVLIAGKGHEAYQIVGETRHAFDDRAEAAAVLEKLANAGSNAQS